MNGTEQARNVHNARKYVADCVDIFVLRVSTGASGSAWRVFGKHSGSLVEITRTLHLACSGIRTTLGSDGSVGSVRVCQPRTLRLRTRAGVRCIVTQASDPVEYLTRTINDVIAAHDEQNVDPLLRVGRAVRVQTIILSAQEERFF